MRFSMRRTQAKSSSEACSSITSSTLRPELAICKSSCVFLAISTFVYTARASAITAQALHGTASQVCCASILAVIMAIASCIEDHRPQLDKPYQALQNFVCRV